MKQRILMAAAEGMRERGVKFTMDDLALRLGISKKTLYQYYPSKDQMISTLVDMAIEDMENQTQEILDSDRDFASRLIALVTLEPKVFGAIPDWVREDIRRCRPQDWVRIDLYREREAVLIVRVLEEGIAAGHLRSISAPVAAQILFSACGGLLEYKFLAANNLTFSDGLQQLKDIFLYGVLGNRAAHRLRPARNKRGMRRRPKFDAGK